MTSHGTSHRALRGPGGTNPAFTTLSYTGNQWNMSAGDNLSVAATSNCNLLNQTMILDYDFVTVQSDHQWFVELDRLFDDGHPLDQCQQHQRIRLPLPQHQPQLREFEWEHRRGRFRHHLDLHRRLWARSESGLCLCLQIRLVPPSR